MTDGDQFMVPGPLPYSSGTKSDEAGVLDGAGLLRASTTIANAMLTSAEGKAAQRAAWVATAGAITPIAATQVSPYRIHRVTDHARRPRWRGLVATVCHPLNLTRRSPPARAHKARVGGLLCVLRPSSKRPVRPHRLMSSPYDTSRAKSKA